MWPWQQKSMQKRYLLWAKLLLISCSFHLVFFLWLFFLHHDPLFDIAITVDSRLFGQRGTPVLFVPFKSKGTVRAGNVAGLVQRSFPMGEQKKKKTSIQQTKKSKCKVEVPQKKQAKKPTVKNKEQKSVKQKKTNVRKLKAKQTVSTKKEIKKEAKNVVAVKNKPTKIQNKMMPSKIANVNAVRNKNQGVVEVNYLEVEAYRRQVLLQEELAKCWKRPIGVPHYCVCQIKVVVNWDGIVKKLDVAKSSGVLMYDVAARSALQTMKMPTWSKGKSLTITFRQ